MKNPLEFMMTAAIAFLTCAIGIAFIVSASGAAFRRPSPKDIGEQCETVGAFTVEKRVYECRPRERAK